jgi:hypothetical protein
MEVFMKNYYKYKLPPKYKYLRQIYDLREINANVLKKIIADLERNEEKHINCNNVTGVNFGSGVFISSLANTSANTNTNSNVNIIHAAHSNINAIRITHRIFKILTDFIFLIKEHGKTTILKLAFATVKKAEDRKNKATQEKEKRRMERDERRRQREIRKKEAENCGCIQLEFDFEFNGKTVY